MPPRIRRFAPTPLWLLSLALMIGACSPKITAPPEPPYMVRRGDEAFRYQDYDGAITAYRAYLDQTDQDEYAARVFYKTALAEYRLGRYRDTLNTLDELSHRYPKGHWVQADALRGDAERELGKPMVALHAWEDGWTVANDNDRRKLRQRILAVARDLNDVDLARARRMTMSPDIAALLDRQIALREPPAIGEPVPETEGAPPEEIAAAEAAAPASAGAKPTTRLTPRETAEQARRPAVTTAPAEEAAAVEPPAPEAPEALPGPLDQEIGTRETTPSAEVAVSGTPKVACLLPLSGSAAAYGQRALRGLQLAFGTDGDRLLVKDTESDAMASVRVWNDVAHDPDVLLVIGPLRSDDAERVAPLSEKAQLATLLLSQRDGLAGRSVVQVGTTRAQLIGGLLGYATDKVRLRRFGVVYPNDAAGEDYLSLFRHEAARHGGTIVGTSAYSSGTPAVTAGTLRTWRKEHNLQAIFLPDSATAAQVFARFLQHEMPDIMLLGIHGWESLGEQDQTNAVSGVLFADAFYPESDRPTTRQFVELFRNTYGEVPGAVEAQAYDAALLAQRALQSGARSRAEVVHEIHALGPIDGVTGELVMTPTGVQREAVLVQVSSGKLHEIGAPAAPVEALAAAESAPAEPVVVEAEAAAPPAEPVAVVNVAPAAAAVPSEPAAPAVEVEEAAAVAPPPAEPAVAEAAAPVAAERVAPPVEAPPPAEAAVPAAENVAAVAPAVVPAVPVSAKVACLLPLSGSDQAYGKRALDGVKLAFADSPDQLMVLDTGGDPSKSASLLRHAADDPAVVAVIGPLRSSEAEVVAPLAERDHVPLLMLSQREGLTGGSAFQIAMTRTQQVELLVRYAVTNMKRQHFGIIHPSDKYGSGFAAAFKTEVENQGAMVVGTQAYPSGSTDFGQALAALKGWETKGLDAVFIPDAAPIATALAAEVRDQMPTVALLGTESWNDAKTLAEAGPALNGAVFADAFFAGSPRASTREFVERFQRGAGRPPTVFEAQAFDAGIAVRRALAAGATSREQMIAQLTGLGTFEAAGELRSSAGGLQRSLTLLRYLDGKVEELPAAGS